MAKQERSVDHPDGRKNRLYRNSAALVSIFGSDLVRCIRSSPGQQI